MTKKMNSLEVEKKMVLNNLLLLYWPILCVFCVCVCVPAHTHICVFMYVNTGTCNAVIVWKQSSAAGTILL